MTSGLRRVPAERFPVGSAPHFEAVLRAYFLAATQAEIGEMLRIAESVVALRKREADRHRWVGQTRASLSDSIRRAFEDTTGVGSEPRAVLAPRMLDVRTFAEAARLRRQVNAGTVDPATFRVANLRNLRLLASLQRSPALGDDPELEQVVCAADLNGKLCLDDLLDLVSYQEGLRDAFKEITLLGCARRYNQMNGYWKASRQSRFDQAQLLPTTKHTRRRNNPRPEHSLSMPALRVR